jgi:hypothetical protein
LSFNAFLQKKKKERERERERKRCIIDC